MARKKVIKSWEDIDCEEFYNLMQTYRHCPISRQEIVIEYYNDVKKYIFKLLKQAR